MQRDVEDSDEEASPKSRPASRRNSSSHSRRSSIKRDKEVKKKSPLNSTLNSNTTTPKKVPKTQNLDLVVTGKQIVKRYDRANSLPAPSYRRPSAESLGNKSKRNCESAKKIPAISQSPKSQETSLEDDVSLDLSQISYVEDNSSACGLKQKLTGLATSTPKIPPKHFQKPRSASVQSHIVNNLDGSTRGGDKSFVSKQSSESTFSYSRDSLYKTSSSASPYSRHGVSTELDYSSVSPEYSGHSSEVSPRSHHTGTEAVPTPHTQDLQLSSCCVSSWQESEPGANEQAVPAESDVGEWTSFWANYNNSVGAGGGLNSYYDHCPTPYRTENIELADYEYSTEDSRKRSPDKMLNINSIIRNEGLKLTPRETQNIIKCAHILGNVLTRAVDRAAKEKEKTKGFQNEPTIELDIKKKTMTLDLKETMLPQVVQEVKRSETVTTQTDISLPNTKSAPKIFENILRQLSRSSIDEHLDPRDIQGKGESKDSKEDDDPNSFKKG